MDKAARIRWAVLLSALAATVAAIFYPLEEAAPRAAKLSPSASARKPILALQIGTPAARGVWEPLLADPFAPRRWDAPPVVVAPPVAPPPPPPPAEAPMPTAPPGPPALPFQFVGQMSDTNNANDKVVYLSRGENALIARVGEVLEGTYKVLDITPIQIEFEHLPTGEKQALALPSRNN